MAQKIRLTETELRKIIREAIGNVVGENPTNPPATTTGMAPVVNAAPAPVGTNYGKTIELAIADIENVKNELMRFTRMPGSFFGIPDDKMQLFGEAIKNLSAAETNLTSVTQ